MTEKMTVTQHHVDVVHTSYSPAEENILRLMAEAYVRGNMKKTLTAELGGGAAYPDLDNEENFKKAVEARIAVAMAVLSGNYTVIPNFQPNGNQNYDEICFACTNYSDLEEASCRITRLLYEAGLLPKPQLKNMDG